MKPYSPHIEEAGLKKVFIVLGLVMFTVLLSEVIVRGGILIPFALTGLPVMLLILYRIFAAPRVGMIVILFIAFLGNAFGRYVDAPWGLSLDIMLILTLFASLFHAGKTDSANLKNGLLVAMGLWTLFTVFEIFNPEATGFEPWFYAVRSISFYILMLIVLVFLVFNKKRDLDLCIFILLTGSAISALYGMKQLHIGLDAAEKAWLAAGAAKTHLLFGRLRVFSFYSDAGQFGAFMAYSALVAGILTLYTDSIKKRVFYGISCLLSFYGMAISGTRGAMFVLAGFMFYLLLTKNFRVFILGVMVAGAMFCFLKYTYIGQGNYQIQRMRSALDPNDPSFQVRLENQRKLAEYMSTRPFGGGIGTIGYWGQRFSPGTYLAEMPPDSHFVRIWAETGIVGLTVHIFSLLYILVISFFKIYHLKDRLLKQKMMAFYAGAFGIVIASYGNQVMSQMPTVIFISISFAFMFHSSRWDKEPDDKTEKDPSSKLLANIQ